MIELGVNSLCISVTHQLSTFLMSNIIDLGLLLAFLAARGQTTVCFLLVNAQTQIKKNVKLTVVACGKTSV